MVYLWTIPNNYPERLIGRYKRENSPDRFLFKKAERLSDDYSKPKFEFQAQAKELRELDDLANSAMIPLISNDLGIFLLDFAPKDIQLIDSIVKAENEELKDYKILNVLNKVAGIDKKNSIFSFVPGSNQIMSFKVLKYKDDCLKGHHIARDAEYSSNLIISCTLAELLLRMNFKGVGLYRPDEMRF